MGDDIPDFEFVRDHEFKVDEGVYVIDQNGFDIYEAVITDIDGDGVYSIHYPDWPDDDCTITDEDERLLAKTGRNVRIYRDQEKIRNENAKGEDSDDEDDEDENYESDGEKKKKKKKDKKKGKQKKEKAPKEPKPKKEKKEKPKKEKKEKPKKEKQKKEKSRPVKRTSNIRALIQSCIQKAAMSNINTIEDFEEFLDQKYGDNADINEHRDLFIANFERISSNNQGNAFDQYDFKDIMLGSDESEYSDSDEKTYDIPEIIQVPPRKQDIPIGYDMQLPSNLQFQDQKSPMSINFDKDGNANAFIWRTAEADYLILNGMKFEINHTKIPEQYFLYEAQVRPIQPVNPISAYVLYPGVKYSEKAVITTPPECNEYFAMLNRSKKKGVTQQLDEMPIEAKHEHKTQKVNKTGSMTQGFIEDSESE